MDNNNTFDKDKFKKSQDKIAIFFIIIFAIGVISIICAFACGNGLFGDAFDDFGGGEVYDFDELDELDATEYLGTYYGFSDKEQTLYTFTLSYDESDETYSCNINISTGMSDTSESNSFKLISAEEAQQFYPNSDYEDCQAIFVYQYSDSAIVIWVTDDGLVLNKNELLLTQSKIDFAQKMGDPKNYYGTFTYSSRDSVTFNKNGKASLTNDGATEEYSYMFVSAAWCAANSPKLKENSLILYHPGSNSFRYFYFKDSNTLWYGGDRNSVYTKGDSGSNGGDNNSGDNNGGGNNSGDNNGGGSTSSLNIADYFGTYYGYDSTEQNLYTLTFDCETDYYSDGVIELTYTNGMVEGDSTTAFQTVELLTPAAAQSVQPNADYEGCPAIIFKQNSSSGAIFWVTDNGLKLNTKDVVLTKKKITFADAMKDPMNYYCTYEFNSKNKLTLKENGEAEFFLNGTTKKRDYLYVSADWCKAHTQGITEASIILYDPNDRNSFIDFYFFYDSKTKLMYNGDTAFVGTGSADIAPDYDNNNTGNDSGSGSGNEGSNTGSSNPVSDSVWAGFFDFSNTTIYAYEDGNEYTAYVETQYTGTVSIDYFTIEIGYYDVTMNGYTSPTDDPREVAYEYWGKLDYTDHKDSFASTDGETFIGTIDGKTVTINTDGDVILEIFIEGTNECEYYFS